MEVSFGPLHDAKDLGPLEACVCDVVVHTTLVNVLENTAWEVGFYELFQGAGVRHGPFLAGPYLGYKGVALTKLVLEVLHRAETFEMTVDHDG